ncbi:hypothetical protein [Nonomuraea insulae]|uniref:DUF4129 domain-containing protein n=1 Tax=Nonomuraea insulae TaxID=1616787 RepID=A0ABW1CJE0_9ACTN
MTQIMEESSWTWRPRPFPMPDFEAAAHQAASAAPDDARRSGIDAAEAMAAGYEPPGLAVVCARRAGDLRALSAHYVAQRDTAEVLLREHKANENERAAWQRQVREGHDEARLVVGRLTAYASRRPGDQLASEVAVSGGFGKRLRRDGPPLLLLAVLLGVEIPIYYETFLDLGDRPLLTAMLAAVAVLVFGLGPHMYGRKFREWQEEGSAPRQAREFRLRDWFTRPSPMTLLPLLWLVTVVAVAVTRLRTLSTPVPYTSSTGELLRLTELADGIGMVPTFILLLALMIFTAMIALETGRRMGNPNDKRLRDGRARLRQLSADLDKAKEQAGRDEHLQAGLEQFLNGGATSQHEQAGQLESGYEQVECAYVAAFLTVLAAEDPQISGWATTIMSNHRRRRH